MLQADLGKMMKPFERYLVTGAAGSVGSSLIERLLGCGKTVCAFDNSEDGMFQLKRKFDEGPTSLAIRYFLGDVRDRERLQRAVEKVDVVFHCAALKHVEMAEINPFETIETNINGVKNVIDSCLNNDVKRLIFTSSDKSVNPSSSMGSTKLIGEKLITSANNLVGSRELRMSTVRFGNVLDSKGSVLKIFKECRDKSLPYPITDSRMTRFFLTMSDAVDLCIHASENTIGGEIFVKSMGAANITKIAQALAESEKVKTINIGAKAGEKLWEELVTEVEALRTVIQNDYFIVVPEISSFTDSTIANELKLKYGENILGIGSALKSDIDDLSWQDLNTLFSEQGIT